MSARLIRALLCLGDWSPLGYVMDEDVLTVAAEEDDGAKDFERGQA